MVSIDLGLSTFNTDVVVWRLVEDAGLYYLVYFMLTCHF